MQTTEEKQEKLRILAKGLPRGAQKEIARKLMLTAPYVCRVLSGIYRNDKVIEEALRLYRLRQDKSAMIEEQLNSL